MKKGFTLIELLVVVLIIGILSAVALPQYTKSVEKARAAEAVSMMKSLSAGVEEYVLANGKSPNSFEELTLVPSNTTPDSDGCIASKNFRYCIQNGPRLQSSRKGGSYDWQYGFIWYSSIQNIGTPGKKFYCYVSKNSAADKLKICPSLTSAAKIQSPTDSGFEWYALD